MMEIAWALEQSGPGFKSCLVINNSMTLGKIHTLQGLSFPLGWALGIWQGQKWGDSLSPHGAHGPVER